MLPMDHVKAKKSGWPRSRQCHEHSSRYDQAWNQFKVLVFNEFGETKDLPIGHFTCLQKGCSGVVRVDSRGFAACEICGYIYNDSPVWVPRKGESGFSHLNKFVGRCKA